MPYMISIKGITPIYEKMLGAGGMGCAFLCHNQNQLTATQHPSVVVKCFWENLTGRLDTVFKEPFTLNKIANDTVPLALDYGYTDSLKQQGPYFVTEYIEGAIDGEAWLETEGPLDFQDGQQIALQIAHCLQRTHEQGIYHLDLKPANLLLKRDQDRLVVKIIDFGLARIAPSLRDKTEQRSGTRSLTAFGQAIFGTWEYAPPEQQGYARHLGKNPDAISDLFAFGKTLYRLLTGELPLEIEEEALANGPQWYKLLSYCTRQNPAKRPKSAKEVITLLQALKPNKPASTPKSDGIAEDDKADGMAEDDKAWQTACEQNTLYAYQAYLKGKTLKRQAHLAKMRIQVLELEADEAAWQWTSQKDSLVAYHTYLKGNTLKQYADEAQQRIVAYDQEIDVKAWQSACEQNSKAAYQAYLNGNTLKKHSEEAEKRLEDEDAWQWTVKKDSLAAYQTYLNGNTLKRHTEQAKQRLIKQAQAADEQAWQKASKQDSKAAYQAYLKGNTLKQHADEAQQRIVAYAQEIDVKAWQSACEQNSKAAYQAYLNGNTLKKHSEEAQKRLEDEEAWQWTCQKDSLAAYQTYLNGKTLKKHLEKAKACLQALEKNKQTQRSREAERKKKAAQQEQAERKTTTDKFFQFEVVTIRLESRFLGFGQKIIKNTKRHQAQYQTEDLGNGVMLEMVSIPGGTFMMGSPKTEENRRKSEGPQHKVTVKPFLMGKYPITQAQWNAVMGKNPSHYKGDNRPVENVSWHDCVEFCKRLFDKTGKAYRLPSESEWEYACRAGTTTPFYFGKTITTDLANYNGRSTYASGPSGVYRGETTDVGSFPPNAFGLYDMHGNVWEWCADLWHDNYDGAPTDGSAWLENKSEKGTLEYLINCNKTVSRLLRGGSFLFDPYYCRAANRLWLSSGNHGWNRGFRGCADLKL